MELRDKHKYKNNIDAMDWAIENSPARHMACLIDNRYMLEKLFENNGIIVEEQQTCDKCDPYYYSSVVFSSRNYNFCPYCGKKLRASVND